MPSRAATGAASSRTRFALSALCVRGLDLTPQRFVLDELRDEEIDLSGRTVAQMPAHQ
jgi:hypothetical protein